MSPERVQWQTEWHTESSGLSEGCDPSVVTHSLSRQNGKLEKQYFKLFFPVSLRNNWHISLCKFKAYSMKVWCRDVENWCGGRDLKGDRDRNFSAKDLTLNLSAMWELNLHQFTTHCLWSPVLWGCLRAEWSHGHCLLCIEANKAKNHSFQFSAIVCQIVLFSATTLLSLCPAWMLLSKPKNFLE